MLVEEKEAELTPQLLKQFVPAKVFKDNQKEITSIDFSKDGKRLITCDDTQLIVYDTENAKKIKTLFNKTKEIDLVKFTHNNEAILCMTRKDHQILYWSLHENEVIKIFTGHTDQIISLEINPCDDSFLSTSRDQTLRLWNLNNNHPGADAIMDLSSKNCYPVANFDPSGLVFAIAFTETLGGTSFTKIALYDSKKYEDGCFTNWKYDCPEIKMLKFSNNNLLILCATAENYIMIVNAYEGQEIQKFNGFQNDNSIIEASFTPDSNYVISGSENGIIYVWNVKDGELVTKLEAHFLKSQVVKFSPTNCLLVSGCKNLIFWIPKEYEDN